jgi:predicted outer membrane repeat protein
LQPLPVVQPPLRQNQSTGASSINDGHGGAIAIRGSQDGSNTATVANCLFVGNSASHDGGAIFNTANDAAPGTCIPQLVNNTFVNNTAAGSGNAIFNRDADPIIANSVLWDGGDEISETTQNEALPTVRNCIILGGYDNPFMPGMNVLDVFPGFVDFDGGDYR